MGDKCNHNHNILSFLGKKAHIIQGPYSCKVSGLNVVYKSIEFKPKTWLSLFVNTSPDDYFIVPFQYDVTFENDVTCECYECGFDGGVMHMMSHENNKYSQRV